MKLSQCPTRNQGFTLLELLIAMTLAIGLFATLFGIFRYAGDAWEKGEAKVVEASNTRLAQNFIRKELSQTFAQRWRDGGSATSKIAFEGDGNAVRFVLTRPANQKVTGLTAVVFEITESGNFSTGRSSKLVVRRALLDADAKDFNELNNTEPRTVLDQLSEASFDYYGAEEDNQEFSWSSSWNAKRRLPKLVRVKAKDQRGEVLPELVVELVVGEESGCYNAAFQRDCPARKL